jgi:hypothetical protein
VSDHQLQRVDVPVNGEPVTWLAPGAEVRAVAPGRAVLTAVIEVCPGSLPVEYELRALAIPCPLPEGASSSA